MSTPTQNPVPAATPAPAAKSYKDTLNLPKTAFPMKANLVQNEPASVKRWGSVEGKGMYEALRVARGASPKFTFHDGPPYANGNIHMGHLMNKVLKDLVVRSKTMQGLDCAYVPGWDCHGLPIEHKVMQELQEAGKLDKISGLPDDQRKMAVRRECQKYAEKYVKLQAGQMERLLTLADYAHPYLTMAKDFEGATLEVLADLIEQGLVYRALKPVHWSIANETALAEAELEYQDREDLSVYVDFEAESADAVYGAFGLAEHTATEEEEQVEDNAGPEQGGPAVHAGKRPNITPCFMIWTTTPWTLPANLAIAVNPALEYALVWTDGVVSVMASACVEKVTRLAKSESVVVIARASGAKLVGLRYKHPFVNRTPSDYLRGTGGFTEYVRVPEPIFSVVAADYVTLEDGTGLVHTAPGHGVEDYQTGLRTGLPIYCPVLADGTYDKTAPEWLQGANVWDANQRVTERLRNSGHLFFDHKFVHSYPHDWRSKTPTIFRATSQWFVAVDRPFWRDKDRTTAGLTLREASLFAVGDILTPRQTIHRRGNERLDTKWIADLTGLDVAGKPYEEVWRLFYGEQPQPTGAVKFVPDWGRNRMRGMLESRPDWCISRQRAWGLPIPAFLTKIQSTGEEFALMTAASVRAVAKIVREQGSDAWFKLTPDELLKYYDPDQDPDPAAKSLFVAATKRLGNLNSEYRKGNDILDVWFESGSSWNAVMRERGLGYPVDLYLEGSDQHRGWFQLSLLPALGATGQPPFKTLLTHGFMVDKHGKKMSKSLGNDIKVEDLLKDHGADVCRWWVCSLSYENDVKVDMEFFALAGESYRKVRNTLRFMLSNLDDYSGTGEAENLEPTSLEAWVLGEFDALSATVRAAYERYDFGTAQEALYNFCNDKLSAAYLAAVKDRLYCDKPDSARRRRTQGALYRLTDGLCRLLAPILCHTADEAWRALKKAEPKDVNTTVHTQVFGAASPTKVSPDWEWAMRALSAGNPALEDAKAKLGVENRLDAGLVLPDPEGALKNAGFDMVDLADVLGVSRVSLDPTLDKPRVADLRNEPRCERSWKRDGTVKARSDGGMLSDRDAAAVGVA